MTTTGHRSILLTPPGAGAIAVIRVVGADPVALVNQAFRPKSGKPLSLGRIDRLRYGHFVDGDEVIDDVVVSVTPWKRDEGTKGRRDGELQSTIDPDVHREQSTIPRAVDISAHGGVRVIERILQTLERLGAPACEPFAALDDVWPIRNWIQREAIEAMCRAKTQRALGFLCRQEGQLPDALRKAAEAFRTDAASAQRDVQDMLARYPAARRLLHGAVVALVGPPNSGKSTLFNRLLGRGAAIVSPTAGTTRDWIAEPIDVDGVPVTLVDTAGGHETDDPLEALAIEAGRLRARDADVRVWVLDSASDDEQAVPPARTAAHPPLIVVHNKCDLLVAENRRTHPGLLISARTGKGMDALLEHVRRTLGAAEFSDAAPCLFTERQARIAREAIALAARDPCDAERLVVDQLIGRDLPVRAAKGAIMSSD